MTFLRFQAVEASPSGRFPGVFALVNGLGFADRLSESERQWWKANNDWFETHLTDPATIDSTVFERSTHPQTSSWFRHEADRFIQRAHGYLNILDEHGVAWIELCSNEPGPILYSDEVQIVVAAVHDPGSLGPRVTGRTAP